MAAIEQAMERVREAELPPHNQQFMSGDRPESYLEARRRVLFGIIDSDMALATKVGLVLDSEPPMSLEYQRAEYIEARVKAANAIIDDDTITGSVKFDLLSELQNTRNQRLNWPHSSDAFEFLKEKLVKGSGLLLRLHFTDPDDEPNRTRKFTGATPVKVDIDRPGFYKFERAVLPQKINAYNMPNFVTDDSGYHIYLPDDVRQWGEKQWIPSESLLIASTVAPDATFQNWVNTCSWPSNSYPGQGDGIFYGQESITDFITRMMTYGGTQLAKIKADVADYPGFEFIHDIEPTGDPGADDWSLASIE